MLMNIIGFIMITAVILVVVIKIEDVIHDRNMKKIEEEIRRERRAR